MRVKHYDYGTHFDCVIHGLIEMTPAEWIKVKAYLLLSRKLFDKRDLVRFEYVRGRGTLYNVRTTATEALYNRFKLFRQKPYKRQNYMLLVKNATE